jgi:ethanolamine ammonia-lyase small subunit
VSPFPATPSAWPEITHDPWSALRRYTDARLALGRVGASQTTDQVLAFSMDHARARDAVHLPLNADRLAAALAEAGFASLRAHSDAANRAQYLKRPDLGRRLAPEYRARLAAADLPAADRLTLVVADGLSARATTEHAVPMLLALRARPMRWNLDAVVIATQARVALADEIGELRGAEAVVILLGERPGLSAPDSLGIYMTYAPRRGRSDAERNCISNVRAAGLSYAEAAYKLHYLLEQSRLGGRSGVTVKDSSTWDAQQNLP